MSSTNKITVINFIDQIWNLNRFEKMEDYISNDFVDYSLPAALSNNKEGMKNWIINTGNSFKHETIINTIVAEGNHVIIEITMQLKHIGNWRGIAPTGLQITTNGYRHYKLKNGKIIAHWALIDGNAIANQLTTSSTSKNHC